MFLLPFFKEDKNAARILFVDSAFRGPPARTNNAAYRKNPLRFPSVSMAAVCRFPPSPAKRLFPRFLRFSLFSFRFSLRGGGCRRGAHFLLLASSLSR
jgi:hypothetical protein